MLRRVSVALVLGLAVVGSAGAATVFGEPNTGPAGSLSLYPLGLASPQSSGPPSGVDLGGQPPDLPASAVGGADPLDLYRRNSHAGRDVDLGAGVASVPEPMAWTMMIAGVGLAGAVLRRRRGQTSLN